MVQIDIKTFTFKHKRCFFLTWVSVSRGQRGVEEGLVLCLLTLALSLALRAGLLSLLGL